MFTKLMVCGFVLGCVSALSSLIELDGGRSGDESVKLPQCAAGEGACTGWAAQPRASTDRFLAMLATH